MYENLVLSQEIAAKNYFYWVIQKNSKAGRLGLLMNKWTDYFYVLLKSYIILCRVEPEEMNWKRIGMSEGWEGWFYEEKWKIGQAPSTIS